jgi:hypothetical protein
MSLTKRLAIFAFFAAYSLLLSQQPQSTSSIDLKPHGFLVNRGIANSTTLGFITETRIGVHLYQNDSTAWLSKLLIFDIGNPEPRINRNDFSGPIIFVNGNLLCFQSNRLELYNQDLKMGAEYQPAFRLNSGLTLESVANNGLKLSPDQLRMSIPVGGASEIVSLPDLTAIHRVAGEIKALGNDRWVVQKTFGGHFTEETLVDSQIKDGRVLSRVPTYLSGNALLTSTNQHKINIEDEDGHLLHSLGKFPTGFSFVAPDRSGDRFVYEVFIAKSLDISGTAQYKKLVLRVFETMSGKEIFHMEEVPSENETTLGHYVAISPSGTRLAVIRSGVLRIYDLPH